MFIQNAAGLEKKLAEPQRGVGTGFSSRVMRSGARHVQRSSTAQGLSLSGTITSS
jgi:hypothetical protein